MTAKQLKPARSIEERRRPGFPGLSFYGLTTMTWKVSGMIVGRVDG
jgi:hypothetical protein